MTTRVMLVDDAVVVRHVLSDTLASVEGIEVVGTACDGKDAMAKLGRYKPDVVVLDVEMPNMDGIETLTAIKASHPHIKVIMFSTLTSRGAAATMDALMAGADDYVTKPANVGSISAAIESINKELAPRIKAVHRPSRFRPASTGTTAPETIGSSSRSQRKPSSPETPLAITPVAPGGSRSPGRVRLVVVAVSTGGPNALAELLPALPATLPVPVAIVQHIPPMFSKALADRLNTKCALEVFEATAGQQLRAGQVAIAPGGMHLTVRKDGDAIVMDTNLGPPENSCRPAADVLFRSAVAAFGGDVLGVILTGMGADGTKGSQAVTAAGGSVLIQDEATSVVWGMPGSVAAQRIPCEAYPLTELAGQIAQRAVRCNGAVRSFARTTGEKS